MSAWSDFEENPTYENYLEWLSTKDRYIFLLPIYGPARTQLWAKKSFDEYMEKPDEYFEEKAEELFDETVSRLGDLAEQIGAELLNVIRGLIPAIIDGLKAGYEVVYADFIKQGPEVIAAYGVIVLLLIVIGYTLLHEVKTGPIGAGEYAANNRFE